MIIKVYKYLSSINFHHWCPSPRPASTNSHLTINWNLLWSKCQLVYSTFEFHKERKKKQKQKAGFGLNSSNFQFMIQRFVSYWSLFPFSLLQQIFWDLMKLRVMKWSLDTGATHQKWLKTIINLLWCLDISNLERQKAWDSLILSKTLWPPTKVTLCNMHRTAKLDY